MNDQNMNIPLWKFNFLAPDEAHQFGAYEITTNEGVEIILPKVQSPEQNKLIDVTALLIAAYPRFVTDVDHRIKRTAHDHV